MASPPTAVSEHEQLAVHNEAARVMGFIVARTMKPAAPPVWLSHKMRTWRPQGPRLKPPDDLRRFESI